LRVSDQQGRFQGVAPGKKPHRSIAFTVTLRRWHIGCRVHTLGLADNPRSGRLRLLYGGKDGPVSPYALIALVALLATVLLGRVLAPWWEQHEQRDVGKKWQARERLLDRRRPIATRQEVLRRRMRSRRPRSRDRRGARRRGRGQRFRRPPDAVPRTPSVHARAAGVSSPSFPFRSEHLSCDGRCPWQLGPRDRVEREAR
jgi:hypothetical protein